MRQDNLLLRTKLSPPRLQRRVLARPALLAHLQEAIDYRLTVVQAGTGYSKTTALAALNTPDQALVWYSVGEADADPHRFLAYLIEAFRLRLPTLNGAALALLQERRDEAGGASWGETLDGLINALDEALDAPALLVLDDFHLVAGVPEIAALVERFLTYLPPDLHVIVATRQPLALPMATRWRARGEVLEIGREALAFSADEIDTLYREVYASPLSSAEIAALADKTEGWPIALQLIWQGIRSGAARSPGELLAQGSSSLGALFDYLAHDVLGHLPAELGAFLRETAVLRELTPAACAAVTGRDDSGPLLDSLLDLDLFLVALGERHYRYHHLFHDFLRQQAAADPAGMQERHRRAARYFSRAANHEDAIYHWLAADDLEQAAAAVEQAGEVALREGWLNTVAVWIDALPPGVLAAHPLLQAFLGDIYRMRSRFDEALAWYVQAEGTWRGREDVAGISRALRGQALVYLDQVQPAQAEKYLEEALRISDGLVDMQARARLLELMAENKLNMGKPGDAETLRAQARALRDQGPGEDALSVRVKLRTGQLDAAQHILEDWAAAERGQVHPPRAHRETLLLLSLIGSLRGQGERAFALAQEGIEVGAWLESPFVTALGHARLGHAWQLRAAGAGYEEAIRCYNTTISTGDRLGIRRLRAEAMWGLTRAYGFGGDLGAAEQAAAEGVETGRWAGDAWISALIELTLGASYVLAGRADAAVGLLQRVLTAFRECGDSFGRTATRLWQALTYHELGQRELMNAALENALALCDDHGYDFLFTAPSMLGLPDPRRLVPLLIAARDGRIRAACAVRLLSQIGLPEIEYHPGYRLQVKTLGAFAVLRGQREVEPRDWQRDKARQLFQLLVTERGRWMQREEIVERLWPSLSAEAAGRDFKVALNALNKAIEPGRAPDMPFSFVAREGTAYRLRPEADLWLDAAAFEQSAQLGLRAADAGNRDEAIRQLSAALAIYAGDYLPDALYEDWTSAERERLLSLYMRAADKLSGALIDAGRYDEALDTAQAILLRDPCWENAYRWMMLAHARQGNRTAALRVYTRCAAAMNDELGVEPSPATVALYRRILQSAEIRA